MASIIPVPILSLYTAERLEQLVCGIPDVSVSLLKQVARYTSIHVTRTCTTYIYLFTLLL